MIVFQSLSSLQLPSSGNDDKETTGASDSCQTEFILVSLAGVWSIGCLNTDRPSGMGTWLCLLWLSTHGPLCGPIQGWSCQYPTLCDHTMSPRELAHPTPPRHIESWKGDSAQRVYSTSGVAFDNLLTLLICILLLILFIVYHSYIPLCLLTVFMLHFIVLLTLFIQHFSTCHIIYCLHYPF